MADEVNTPKKLRPLKPATLASIQNLIFNDACVLEKHNRVIYAEGPAYHELKQRKEETLNQFITIPRMSVPISIKFSESADRTREIKRAADLYRYSSWDELRAIYYNESFISNETGRYAHALKPSILGTPNYDSSGVVIVLKDADTTAARHSKKIGFGKFACSADGAEDYMRLSFMNVALETDHTTYRRKLGYQAHQWCLEPYAKTMLRAFFKKYGPAEEVITPEMMASV